MARSLEPAGASRPAPFRLEPPPPQRATTAERIFHVLRQAIVTTQIRPGDVLAPAEIAQQLGVSRQPVREAFIMLTERRLIDVVPQRGTFVLKISVKDVQNAEFVREAIEVAVVRRAAEFRTEADLRAIASVIAGQKAEAMESPDYAVFLDLDRDFHKRIADAAGRAEARSSIEPVNAQLDRVRFLSLPIRSHIPRIIEDHEAILAAIEARDPDEAGRLMSEHVAAILSYLPILEEAHPEMFIEDAADIRESA